MTSTKDDFTLKPTGKDTEQGGDEDNTFTDDTGGDVVLEITPKESSPVEGVDVEVNLENVKTVVVKVELEDGTTKTVVSQERNHTLVTKCVTPPRNESHNDIASLVNFLF